MSTKTQALGMWPIPENSLQKDPVIDQNAEATAQVLVGIVSRNLASDANYTLLPADYLCAVLVITDTGVVLTVGRDIVFPALFARMLVTNGTAQTLTLKMVGKTGITLAPATSTTVVAGPDDVIEAAVAGGGGLADAPSDGTTYGRKDAAWEPVASGGLGKLAQVVVTTAQTDIDFSSLDLDADGIYRLEVFVVPGATGVHVISLFYNGDTTVGNYRNQMAYALYATVGAGSGNNAELFFSNSLPDTTNPMSFSTVIRKATGVKPVSETFATSVHNSGEPFQTTRSHRWDSTANVTSIKLRNTITNGFGVGTFARLYRMN